MKVETLDGKLLGSFSVPPEERGYALVELLGDTQLSLDDCNGVRIVDFDGRTELAVHSRKGCSVGDTKSSADGRRMLFDFTSHKVSVLQTAREFVFSFWTFGEARNREDVQVVDGVTGKSCFDWHRSFRMTYGEEGFRRSAAISPSGEFVAIAAGNTLSIYRLPATCEAQ
jgi:hypothetical protein